MDEDFNLIKRISDGDKAAMSILFERYHASLTAFLIGRGADASQAADVLQDAMLDVWRTADRFAFKSSAKTWVFTIARNKLIDQQRKSNRINYLEEVPEAIDETPDAEALMMSANDTVRVRACLDGLKPHHLSVVRLAFFDDLSYGQIAEVEDVPLGTIKTRIFHAKKLLMRCLGHV